MDRVDRAKRRQACGSASMLSHRSVDTMVDQSEARQKVIKPVTKCISKQAQSSSPFGHTQNGRQLSSFILFASVVILLNLCPPFHLDSDQAPASSKALPDIATMTTSFVGLSSTMSPSNDPSHLLTTATTMASPANNNHHQTLLDTCLEFVKLMFRNPMRMSKRMSRFTLAEARVLGKMAKVWYIKKKIKKLSKKLKKHTIAVPVFTAIPIYEHSYYPQPHVTHVTHGAMHHHAAASSYAPSSVVAAGTISPLAAASSSQPQLATAASNQQHQVAAYRMAPAGYGQPHHSYQAHGMGGGGVGGGHRIINAYTPSQPLFVDDTGGLYGHYGNAYGRYDGGFHYW